MQNKIYGSTKLYDLYRLSSTVKIIKFAGNVCRSEGTKNAYILSVASEKLLRAQFQN
jgi:hypothetical protein